MALTATPNVCLIYISTQHSAAWVLARNKLERGVIHKGGGLTPLTLCNFLYFDNTPRKPSSTLTFFRGQEMQKLLSIEITPLKSAFFLNCYFSPARKILRKRLGQLQL